MVPSSLKCPACPYTALRGSVSVTKCVVPACPAAWQMVTFSGGPAMADTSAPDRRATVIPITATSLLVRVMAQGYHESSGVMTSPAPSMVSHGLTPSFDGAMAFMRPNPDSLLMSCAGVIMPRSCV